MDGELLYTVEWTLVHEHGEEHFELLHLDQGYRLQGKILAPSEGRPVRANYQIDCDSQWRTRRVHVDVDYDFQHRFIDLTLDSSANWHGTGTNLAKICGCMDVDLEFTPATNLLPIRRLRLRPGASAEIRAAWVRFPALTVEPLRQVYTRLSETRYHYESGSGYQAEIEVDEWGLAVQYGDVWTRKAQT